MCEFCASFQKQQKEKGSKRCCINVLSLYYVLMSFTAVVQAIFFDDTD